MQLTNFERLVLLNQFRMLEKLDSDGGDYREEIKILENGYVNDYYVIFEHLSDELPEAVSKEVYDILQMHRSLLTSYNNLGDKTGINQKDVMFNGFDANSEGKHYSYARFLILDCDRYNEFKNQNLNSHYSILEKYRKMLVKWSNYDRYASLDRNQIEEIINVDR